MHGGRCKILGVLVISCDALGTDLEILGNLSATFPFILRSIWGATAPPAPSVPPTLLWN